jgi:hypothetical protein
MEDRRCRKSLFITCLSVNRILQIEGDIDNGPYHLISVSLRSVLKAFLHYVTSELML